MKPEEKPLSQQAQKALQEAANRVVEEARRTHSTVVVWEQGAVHQIRADQLPPAMDQAATGGSST